MALKLRCNEKSITLATGQLLIGRSVECNLVVNDPLASRRHAMITMGPSGAFVSDLDSKAGVLVNGLIVSGARKLASGDVLLLAGVRIVVEDIEEEEAAVDPKLRPTLSPPPYATTPAGFRLAPTPPLGLPRLERLHADSLEAEEDGSEQVTDFSRTLDAPRPAVTFNAGAEARPPSARGFAAEAAAGGPTSDPDRRTAPAPPEAALPPARPALRPEEISVARVGKLPPLPSFPRPDHLRALAGMAEKAIALQRPEDGERIAQRALLDMLDAARRGDADAPSLELAASLGARLAAALSAGRWFDYAVELYATRTELMPAAVVDLLLEAVRKARPIDRPAFRAYVAEARDLAGDSPARRFVIQRLEGVQRLLDLK